MMVGITGTPGTGKTTISTILRERGYTVISATSTAAPFVTSYDQERDTQVVDLDAWAERFEPVEGFVEGHLAHFLPCNRVVVLRCHPGTLCERLKKRGYKERKIRENAEAEAIDVILVEAVEECGEDRILEIDTTCRPPDEICDIIAGFYNGSVQASCGGTDWSEWFLNEGSVSP